MRSRDARWAYEVLGLPFDASPSDVREVYRDLIAVWHPDRFQGNARLTERVDRQIGQVLTTLEASGEAERTLVASLVPAGRTGLAFGWFNFAIGISALPASLIFGMLYQSYGPQVAFSWSAGLALVAVILLTAVGRSTPHAATN